MSFKVRRLADDKKPRRPFPWKKLASGAALVVGPALTVVEYLHKREEKKHEKEKQKEEQLNMVKRGIVVVIALVCAWLLFMATARAFQAIKILSVRSILAVASNELPADAYGHTNILLLGKGDATHDGVDLTDTMMIASLDPKTTKTVAMLSIPRDLYLLSTQKMGKGKINTMYRDYKASLIREGKTKEGASSLAMKEMSDELGRALGMTIHHAVMVDFSGFTKAVDSMGGVDVEVTQDIVDTEYPTDEYTYTTFQLAAGMQHLDGDTALKYARSRHSTSDFDRSRRQQQLLHALADKAKSAGVLARPDRINELLGILKEHVETTLSLRDMAGLAKMVSELDQSNIITLQLNDRNGLYNTVPAPGGFLYTPPRAQFGGASVLLPVSIPPEPVTWKQINTLVSFLMNERSAYSDRSTIDILNAGAPSGSSRKLGNEFTRYGMAVGRLENADSDDIDASVIRASDTQKDKALFLANLLKMKLETTGSGAVMGADGSAADTITILLGTDFTYTPLQDLRSTPTP